MSVYHSIRGSVQPSTVEEDVEDQDGLVLVDLNAEPEPEMATIHPAERISGQVCIPIKIPKYYFNHKQIPFRNSNPGNANYCFGSRRCN